MNKETNIWVEADDFKFPELGNLDMSHIDMSDVIDLEDIKNKISFRFDQETPIRFFLQKNAFEGRNKTAAQVVCYVNKKGADRNSDKNQYIVCSPNAFIVKIPAINVDITLTERFDFIVKYFKKGENFGKISIDLVEKNKVVKPVEQKQLSYIV